MADKDVLMWKLIQESIGKMMGEEKNEQDIIREIMKTWHGIADFDSIRREITRQKRMTVN